MVCFLLRFCGVESKKREREGKKRERREEAAEK
jgi:hypothetical protein